MNIIDALGRGLTDTSVTPSRYPAVDNPRASVEALVSVAGSGRAAARYLGVAESTLRGWRHGVTPKRDHRQLASAARTAMMLGTQTWNDAYTGVTQMMIKGWVVASSDRRNRTIKVGIYIPQQRTQAVLRAWLAGDDARAERLLNRAIFDHYEGVYVEDANTDYVWFE